MPVKKLSLEAELWSETKRKLNERIEQLSALYDISKSIVSTLDLNKVLNLITNKAAHIMEAEVCTLRLLYREKNELVLKASYGLDEKSRRLKKNLKIGESIAGKVVQKGKPYIVDNLLKDQRYKYPQFARRKGLRSLLAVPLIEKDRIIGVLSVYIPKIRYYEDEHVKLLSMFASQVTVAIENARLYRSLQDIYMNTITALASTIDAKDHYTRSHSEHVTKYAVAIAKEMKLSKPEIEDIRRACQLHDLGKIGVHDYILTKPDKLTKAERKEIKLHSSKGAEILKSLPFLNGIIDLVKQHHERYDGTGYPDGCNGYNIKIGARIMAVADAFDAMTSERPYRKAFSKKEAIIELKSNKGTQFDPKIVNAFLRVLKKHYAK